MTDFKHLMVDTECMGNGHDGALVQIGAVFFDANKKLLGPEFCQTIHLGSAMHYGGTAEAGTIMFWLGQPDAARNSIRFGGRHIREVLTDFSAFIKETCRFEDVRLWGNSAAFDLNKIESAYLRLDLPVPWYWTNERDFRTLRNHYPKIEYNPAEKGEGAHNALVDAKFQARHLFKLKDFRHE